MAALKRRKFLKTAALVTASAGLAACGSSGAAPSTSPGEPREATAAPTSQGGKGQPGEQREPALQPKTETLAPPEEQAQATVATTAVPQPESQMALPLAVIAAHRLQFGPRPGDWEAFQQLGANDDERLNAYLDAQLSPDSIDDSAFEERYGAAGFETLHKTLEELASDHIVHNPFEQSDDRHWEWYSKPVDELVEAAFLRAVYSRHQLEEVLVDFWHNHFNVYGWQDDAAPLIVSYDRDVIRRHALGNFREFLEAVASHPSMLFYLDNRSNSDAGPNENFARELFELYTLGAENYLGVREPNSVPADAQGRPVGYVDNDVYEAARCFTGWRVDDDLWDGEDDIGDTLVFRYHAPWHDRYNKFVLGRYLPADQADQQDGRDVLDMLASHPGTAHFIAGKLCRRLVADSPPESLVQHAAQVFLETASAPDQIAQVVRAIVTSAEFRTTWKAKVKRPFEAAAAAMRVLEAEFVRLPGGVRWVYEMMGQPLFGYRPPNGYADTAASWANTMATLYGWNLFTGLVHNWWSEEEDGNNVATDVWSSIPNWDSADGIVDYWLERAQLVDFPADSRQAVVDFLADGDFGERLPAAVGLILMSPDFRNR